MLRVGRKVRRVPVRLDVKGIRSLHEEEIRAILRGADDLIMCGGRNLLAKVLKGSRDAKVLERGLEKSPVYGYFSSFTLAEITAKIDWMIKNDYLEIEYDYRLPLLKYSEKGWEIEKETIAREWLQAFERILSGKEDIAILLRLKGLNRGLILLILDKIEAARDTRYIPLLQYWASNDFRKVRERIVEVIKVINA